MSISEVDLIIGILVIIITTALYFYFLSTKEEQTLQQQKDKKKEKKVENLNKTIKETKKVRNTSVVNDNYNNNTITPAASNSNPIETLKQPFNYDKWNNIGDEEQGPPPSPVDHAGALPAMRVSERDDGGISFDFTTMQPEANDDLVTLNPLGGDDVDENEKPGIYRRATPGEAPPPAPAPRVLGVCSSSTCSKDATLRCGVCKVAKYCSVACQRRDWKSHKAVCAPIRTEKAGQHLRTSAE